RFAPVRTSRSRSTTASSTAPLPISSWRTSRKPSKRIPSRDSDRGQSAHHAAFDRSSRRSKEVLAEAEEPAKIFRRRGLQVLGVRGKRSHRRVRRVHRGGRSENACPGA